MAGTLADQVFVELIADNRKYKKGLEEAPRIADKNLRAVETRAQRAEKNLAGLMAKAGGSLAGAFTGGLLGGVAAGGIGGIAAAVRDTMKSFADLEREAKTANLQVEDFQKWRYAADQNRISISSLVDGFKELSLRADEYVASAGKSGSAAESFRRLGLSPQEVKERIKDPSKFMLELIDRTRQLKDTAAGVRIFDELLGGQGGEQFVRLIEQGREGVSATLNEFEKMGAVIDQNAIRRAEEVDKAFQRITTTVGVGLKNAIVTAFTALQAFISQLNELEDKSVSGITAELDQLRQARDRLATTQAAGGWEDSFAGLFGKDRVTQLAAITAKEKELNDQLEKRKKIELTPIPDTPTFTPIPEPEKKSRAKSAEERAREKAVKAAEREREAVRNLIGDLQFEASLIGKSAVEKEKLTALRQAGAAATAEEKAQIEALIEANYRQSEAYDKTQVQLQELTDASRDFTGTLIDGLLEGEKASEVLSNALKSLASRFLNSGLDALFNGLFAGAGGSTPHFSRTSFKGDAK